MSRLSFFVNRGENDCFMIHGIDWATYHEGGSWTELTATIRAEVDSAFRESMKPTHLDFKFDDGTVRSIVA